MGIKWLKLFKSIDVIGYFHFIKISTYLYKFFPVSQAGFGMSKNVFGLNLGLLLVQANKIFAY
jgi:hypothetical protein